MSDITITCQGCGAKMILPAPDAVETGDGVLIPTDPDKPRQNFRYASGELS